MLVPGTGTVGLLSGQGDYLHRPDGPGVTTWGPSGGSDWFVEAIHTTSP